jgi:hypothetical protein
MSLPEKQTIRDSKSGDSSPSPQSDIEIGSVAVVEEVPKDGDEALRFLKSHHAVGELTIEDEKKLLRKIDWMVMPLMWSCYCLQYLDKTLGKIQSLLSTSNPKLSGFSKLRGSNGSLR